ncbi:hypothetical protein BC828DRAFT_406050 [Blastocladiella britannica]|nr:hypothetical protein BC828DRAFT_406050 [Blastocladiella britannica]
MSILADVYFPPLDTSVDNLLIGRLVHWVLHDYHVDPEKVIMFASDSAAYMKKAWRDRLALMRPETVYLPCFAHIINLVGEAIQGRFGVLFQFMADFKAAFKHSPRRCGCWAREHPEFRQPPFQLPLAGSLGSEWPVEAVMVAALSDLLGDLALDIMLLVTITPEQAPGGRFVAAWKAVASESTSITLLALAFLLVPISTAEVERAFSRLSWIESDLRKNMSDATVAATIW